MIERETKELDVENIKCETESETEEVKNLCWIRGSVSQPFTPQGLI